MANDDELESENARDLFGGTAPERYLGTRGAIRFVLDGNGNFARADPEFEAAYGTAIQAGDGVDPDRIQPAKHVLSALHAALAGTVTERRFVLFPDATDQEPVWIFEALPFDAPQLAAGKGVAAVFVRCDVQLDRPSPEEGRLSEDLNDRLARERLGTKKTVVATIRHEISNALTTIIGNAELMLRKAPAVDAASSDRIQEIVYQGRRIQLVIEKLDALTEVRTTKHYGGYEMLDLGRRADSEAEDSD